MGLSIRPLHAEDRDAVRRLLEASRVFSADELRVADELLTAGLEGEYSVVVAELQAEVAGYACLGPTPLTESTWHLYWLCVHPSVQGQGVGQALQAHAERLVRARGGTRLVVETSGRPDYERARRFYERAGYRPAGRIPNYYRPGDDCLFYCKPLAAAGLAGAVASL